MVVVVPCTQEVKHSKEVMMDSSILAVHVRRPYLYLVHMQGKRSDEEKDG
jgi:hypothetical protein